MGTRRKEKKPLGPVAFGLLLGLGMFIGALLAVKHG